MINYTKQVSRFSHFTGVNEDTGGPLPEEIWSDLAWATEFAQALSLNEFLLSWTACTIYLAGRDYAIPAGSYQFVADATYSQSIVIWLDETAPDNLTIDIILLDDQHSPPPAPIANGTILRLAWGTISIGASTMTLNALYHMEDI